MRHALGLLASLHWGLTLPQGRCGRWLLLLDALPVQPAGGQCAADLAVLLSLYSALVRHALGLLASLDWGLTLPQGRYGRWLLVSYLGRLQMEGAKMVGGAGVWRGQRMQEDNT